MLARDAAYTSRASDVLAVACDAARDAHTTIERAVAAAAAAASARDWRLYYRLFRAYYAHWRLLEDAHIVVGSDIDMLRTQTPALAVGAARAFAGNVSASGAAHVILLSRSSSGGSDDVW
jgi:hypothetical protein